MMGRYGVKDRNVKGEIMNFAKRMEISVVNMYFNKREEHKVIWKMQTGELCLMQKV